MSRLVPQPALNSALIGRLYATLRVTSKLIGCQDCGPGKLPDSCLKDINTSSPTSRSLVLLLLARSVSPSLSILITNSFSTELSYSEAVHHDSAVLLPKFQQELIPHLNTGNDKNHEETEKHHISRF
ncbi:unnamed protein product [Pleuronectes platessa]|uniref:Uncharacterized protein n=1 Tax=Pleuronectes platessa TaxID=8262 RepID=A0A9N7UUN6_PLEPL|nr:unnamed protein product [Pleuronectes platessa]